MLRMLSLVLVNVWLAASAYAGSLWFSDGSGIHRIDTSTGAVTATVAQDGVVALALDQRNDALWILTGGRLRKLDASTAMVLDIDLKTLATNFNAAARLALDPSDGSVWIAGGNNAFHVDASGATLASIATKSIVQDIALAQDESLWVLGRNELAHYGPQGTLLGSANLTAGLQQAAFIVSDDANGVMWLGGAKTLVQLAPTLPLSTRLTLATAETISGLALDAGSGNLWVAGQSSLFAFTKGGGALASIDLARRGIANFQVLDFDAPSQSLWLGHERGISRFDAAGTFVATLPASVKVTAISAAPSGIVPIVTLVAPADGALTRNAFEPIRLHYDASCFGQPCGFPSSVFAAYALTASLNGQSVGGLFQFDPATNTATYTPVSPHAQGLNTLSAFVTDTSGRRSRTITSTFTVDSVAPRFVNVQPADGSIFRSPAIALTGSLDDATARTLLESFSGATFSGANPQASPFSYAIQLKPGANVFRLTATDPAGNATPLSLTYTFSTLTLTITSPANGATIDDTKVDVSGTFTGAATATVTVNAIPATVTGTSFTAANVPLRSGANTLTAVGVSADGATDTRSITVTSVAPSISITSPAAGASLSTDHAFVTGRVQAPANSGVTVNGVLAYVDAAGNFFANDVTLLAGPNTITAKVTTPSGRSVSADVVVTSSGASPIVVTAVPTQGAAPLTVQFFLQNRGALPITSFGFGPGCFGSQVATTDPEALFAFSYPQPGLCQAVVTVSDASGNSYPQPMAILVQDPAQLDQMFRALWSGLNSALAAGDKAKAMTFLSTAAQEKYGRVFDQLMPNMPAIVASYSPLQRVSLSPRIAEYAVNRTIDGVNRVFLVYFLQDANGVWLIDAM
jgi:hypothetical protein